MQELSGRERAILARVEGALASGRRLRSWWEERERSGGFAGRFELVRSFNRPDSAFGFFDLAPLGAVELPVMGTVQEMLYDRPKRRSTRESAAGLKGQVREFVLRYLLRVSDFRPPAAYPRRAAAPRPGWLSALSLCPEPEPRRKGFGYSQLYFRERAGGRVGKFPPAERFAIVDLRELGARYEWVVLKVRIFDFNLSFLPLGAAGPRLNLPAAGEQLVVLSPDFVLDRDRPAPEVLGEYGFGYAVMPDPEAGGLLAYGPGRFDAGFQLFRFRLLESGEIGVRLAFVVNRLKRLVNFPSPAGLDPVLAGISLANALSAGAAARELCLSREQLEQRMLVQHFMQHYEMVVGSLLTWRQIPDWTDPSALPAWVLSGVSS
jgi:hypothetical protein